MKHYLIILSIIVNLLFPSWGNAATQQLLCWSSGGDTLPASAGTQYFSPNGSASGVTSDASRYMVVPCDGTISTLKFWATVAPAVDNQWVLTLRVGSRGAVADSFLTCTIAGAEQVYAGDLINSVPVTAGQVVNFKLVTTEAGTIPASYGGWSCVFTPTVAGKTVLMGNTAGGTLSAVDTTQQCINVASPGAVQAIASVANAQIVMPCAGNITGLYAYIDSATGAGKSRNFFFNLSGVEDASFTVNIANGEYVKGYTAESIAVSAGDLVCVSTTNVGGALASVAAVSLIFEPTIKGQFVFALAHGGAALSTAANNYFTSPNNARASAVWGLVENRYGIYVPLAMTVNAMYVNLTGAPGAGNSHPFKLRDDGVAVTGAAVTFSDAEAGVKSATGLTSAVASGSMLTLHDLPASTPDAGYAMFSIAGYIAPTVTSTGNFFSLF